MDIRRVSQIGCVAGAVLLLILCPSASVRAQFAPVNKARGLEKSVIEGDDEVRKVKTGQVEIKSAKPAPTKPKPAKPKIVKALNARKAALDKVVSAKAQRPPKSAKPAPTKSVAAKPAPTKPAAKPAIPKATPAKPTPPKTMVAATRPAPKKRRVRMRYVKPTPMIVIEGIDRQGLISTISEEGRFVYLRVTPETVFRAGNQVVPVTAIVDGMKLDCWGGWEKTAPDVYTAKGVLVKGKLDDYALRIKINEACQKLSRVRPSVAAGPVQPISATETAVKPEEKKPDEKKPEEPKPGEPKPGEPKPEEPKPADPNAPPADPNAPPANPEEPKPTEPKPTEPGNP